MTWQVSKVLLALIQQGYHEIDPLLQQLKNRGVASTRPQILRLARAMKRNGQLQGSAQNGYVITREGLTRLHLLELKQIKIPRQWDGSWRLLLFDIPEEKRQLRNQVRHLAKALGCQQLQHSVWIHPFDCFEHFQQIRSAYGETNDIIFLKTQSLEHTPKLLSYFTKTYPDTKFN